MTLKELTEDYRAYLTQIDGSEVLNHWAYRWYDDPLSGVALYRGQHYLFESRHDDEVQQRVDEHGGTWNDWYKSFVLVELSPEQYQQLAHSRERVIREQETWAGCFGTDWNKLLSGNQVVGWFEWLWANAEQQ